jgi:ribosome assembly protein YihI (activator of Der GTPase)
MTGRTVNFTGTVDRDLLRRLKILAAKLATSINALFNAELRHLVETYEAAEAHGNHNFQTLLDFSLGRINDLQAMEALGIESEEDLFLLMTRAHLPMPRLDANTTREMTESLHSLVK